MGRIGLRDGRLTRRDLLWLSASLTAGAALSACGGDVGDRGTSSTELQYMYWGSAFEKRGIESMLTKFSQSHKGIGVNPIHVPGDYETKVNTLVASNDLPDVAYMGAATAYRLAEQGKLLNLHDHINKYPLLKERSPGSYFYWGKDKNLGTHASNQIILLWYNKAILSEAGIEKPPAEASKAWSLEQLVDIADQLTLDDEGRHPSESGFRRERVRQFGLSVPITHWYPLVLSNGGDIVDKTGMKYTLNSPEAVKVLQDIQDLIYKHRVAPSPAQLGGGDTGSNAPTTTVQLQTKRVAMAVDGHWTLLDMAQSDVDYGIGVLPSYQEPITQQNRTPRIIAANTENLDEAFELYVFAMNPEYVDLYSKGLWMPVDEKYFTDPASIAKWVNDDVHPPEFKTAAIDYLRNNSVPGFAERLKNVTAINEVLVPALQEIETGKRPAKVILDELEGKMQPRLQGWYPTTES
ncbi:ABC transporter substrate-binding protein [Actinopolymorpha pittospori]